MRAREHARRGLDRDARGAQPRRGRRELRARHPLQRRRPTTSTAVGTGSLTLEGGTVNYSGTYNSGDEDLDADGHRHAREPDRRDRDDLANRLEPGAGDVHVSISRRRGDTSSPTRRPAHPRKNLSIERRPTCAVISAWKSSALVRPSSCSVRGKVAHQELGVDRTVGTRSTQVEGRRRLPVRRERRRTPRPCTSSHKVYRTVNFFGTVPTSQADRRSGALVREREAGPDESELRDGQPSRDLRQRQWARTGRTRRRTCSRARRTTARSCPARRSSVASPTHPETRARSSSTASSSSTARSSSRATRTFATRAGDRSTPRTRSRSSNYVTLCGVADVLDRAGIRTRTSLRSSAARRGDRFDPDREQLDLPGRDLRHNDFSQKNSVSICGPVIAQELNIENNTTTATCRSSSRRRRHARKHRVDGRTLVERARTATRRTRALQEGAPCRSMLR